MKVNLNLLVPFNFWISFVKKKLSIVQPTARGWGLLCLLLCCRLISTFGTIQCRTRAKNDLETAVLYWSKRKSQGTKGLFIYDISIFCLLVWSVGWALWAILYIQPYAVISNFHKIRKKQQFSTDANRTAKAQKGYS